MFDLGCSCDAVGGGFPRRYLAWLPPHTRAGCFSCQLSNITHKKVDAPRRGCTYGPMAYADCHEDCRNTGINIQRDQREVNARALLPTFLCGVPRLACIHVIPAHSACSGQAPAGNSNERPRWVGLYSLRSRRHSAALRVTIPNAKSEKKCLFHFVIKKMRFKHKGCAVINNKTN